MSKFYLVFEFCEHDLAGLLCNPNVAFTLAETKQIMKQMMNGLYYIHGSKILHRDMKAANILISKLGVLKLADFGLARAYSVNASGELFILLYLESFVSWEVWVAFPQNVVSLTFDLIEFRLCIVVTQARSCSHFFSPQFL